MKHNPISAGVVLSNRQQPRYKDGVWVVIISSRVALASLKIRVSEFQLSFSGECVSGSRELESQLLHVAVYLWLASINTLSPLEWCWKDSRQWFSEFKRNPKSSQTAQTVVFLWHLRASAWDGFYWFYRLPNVNEMLLIYRVENQIKCSSTGWC